MNPTVSIIVPVYNAERFLRDTVDTITQQTFTGWEIVFFDGGSTDRTMEIIKEYQAKYPSIQLYSAKTEGPYDAIMRGAEKIRGEYVAVVAISDGYLNNQWLEKVVAVMKNDPEVSLVWGIPFDMTEEGKILGPHFVYAHFLEAAPSGRRWALVKKIFWKVVRNPISLFTKLHRSNVSAVGHMLRKETPPQKIDWFKYWLETGMIFPDGNMVMSRKAFLECMPPYPPGSYEPGDWMIFYFDFNARGFLSYCLPVPANVGRTHGGQVSDVHQKYNDEKRVAYFKKIAALREKLKHDPESMVFIDRSGKPLPARVGL